jgi:hypothetical protein
MLRGLAASEACIRVHHRGQVNQSEADRHRGIACLISRTPPFTKLVRIVWSLSWKMETTHSIDLLDLPIDQFIEPVDSRHVFSFLFLHDLISLALSVCSSNTVRKQSLTFSSLPRSSFSWPVTLLGVDDSTVASASLSGQSSILCFPFFKVFFLPKSRSVVPPSGTTDEFAGGPP